MYYVKTIDINC